MKVPLSLCLPVLLLLSLAEGAWAGQPGFNPRGMDEEARGAQGWRPVRGTDGRRDWNRREEESGRAEESARRMTSEERRQLRQDINDAGRDIYPRRGGRAD